MNRLSVKAGIQKFSLSYFALPMSTGILAIASYTIGYRSISTILFILNHIEIIVLLFLLVFRLAFFFPDFKKDLSTAGKGAGSLTLVAALGVSGAGSILLNERFYIAIASWYFALAIWFILVYSFSIATIVKQKKPSFRKAINGSWLLFVVSAQTLSILGNLIAKQLYFQAQNTLFVTLLFYLLGALFYLIIISLISFRAAFFPMKPKDFRPSYWINMGAAAISTLSGILLIQDMAKFSEFQNFIPILKVFTVLFWIGGTWWLPVIVYLEVWKRNTVRVKYNSDTWSLVFPLGVYTLCTWHLSDMLNLPFLKIIPQGFIFIAWGVWLFTYYKMLRQVKRLLSLKVLEKQQFKNKK